MTLTNGGAGYSREQKASSDGSFGSVDRQPDNYVLEVTSPASHPEVGQSLLEDLPAAASGQRPSDAMTLTSGGAVADSNGFFHPQGDRAETTHFVTAQSYQVTLGFVY